MTERNALDDGVVDPDTPDESAYFYARAERQLALAERSEIPAAVQAHSLIANRYLEQAYGITDDGAATDDLVSPPAT